MRAVSLALAMGALLFGSGVFANETVHQERSDISEAPSHVLQRRTFGHGSYSYCSDKRYKLAFHSGSGSCSCVSSCGSKQKECPDPRSGKGYGACSGKGCTIICNNGFELSNGDCKAIPPKCEENEIISNGKCVCPSGFEVKKGACVKIPTCKEFERWNGKSCECAPSCGRHKKTNQCEPQCPVNSWYDGKAGECKCDYKFIKVNGQCKPDCGSDKEWCDDSHKCICKPGFVDIWGTCKPVPTCPIGQSYDKISKSCKCPEGTQLVGKWCKPIVPSCPKNEVYDFKTKSCICIPSCKRGHKNTCEPVTPPPVGPSQKPKPKPGHGHWAQDLHKAIWDSRHHRREQDAEFCPDGLSACPISQTLGGGYECLDTTEELENCGGCTANGDGVDCTAIPNASGVGCQAGRCVVFSCAANFRLSPAGECTPSLFFSSA